MSRSRVPAHDADLPDELAARLSAGLNPHEPAAAQRERLRLRVFAQARGAAQEGTASAHADVSPWIELAPLIEIRVLRRDEHAGTHTSLIRMHPGGVIPAHQHAREEELVILEGECQIDSLTLRAGDAHLASPGSRHGAVTTRTGVLALLRGEYPYPTAEHSSP